MDIAVRVCSILNKHYGRKKWAAREPVLDALIRTILSQNTTAANCSEAFRSLMERFPTWAKVRDARWEDIADAIRTGGLANRKAPRIKMVLEQVCARGSESDLEWVGDLGDAEALEYLMGFDGVGRKTAACVLMFALGRRVVPVDTHVYRVSKRLGLIGNGSVEKAHDQLQAMVPPDRVYSFHVNMVRHGREVCHARSPKCEICVLRKECVHFAGQTEAR